MNRTAMEAEQLIPDTDCPQPDGDGILARQIAHDVNNIITSIVGYAELIKASKDPEKRLKHVTKLLAACEYATRVTGQLLKVHKPEDRIKPVDIRSSLTTYIETLSKRAPDNVTIEHTVSQKPIFTMVNSFHVFQILGNLCENAIQAMHRDGGTLKITLNSVEVAKTSDIHAALRPGVYAHIRVSDTGHGIPPEVMDRIFLPYVSTRAGKGGNGLGLSFVKDIVNSHGGTITVSSCPGKETTFEVYLPRILGIV